MKKESEQEIQKAIIDYLRMKKYVVFKHHSTGSGIREGKSFFFKHGDRGISDIIACSPKGKFTAIEVKRKGGKVSDDQIAFIKAVILNGGDAFVAHSIDEVISQIS